MKTKLSHEYLAQSCLEVGLEPTKYNMAVAAFLNDPKFRDEVTRFFFQRALSEVKP